MPQLNGGEQSKSFNANERLVCRVCGAVMYLIRRTPLPDFGHTYERQTFRCVSCQKEVERSANKKGHAHA
jgi:hypothetical protein